MTRRFPPFVGGFGWNEGSGGPPVGKEIAGWIAEDIAAGKTLSSAPLPTGERIDAVHTGRLNTCENLARVYQRQAFQRSCWENAADPKTAGNTIFETTPSVCGIRATTY